jgi:thiamine-phosphate pyrophosphorylase
MLRDSSICLLATAALSSRPLLEAVEAALEAGVRMVQLREKSLPDREFLLHARALRELTARRGALLVINDRPDLALLCHADGVHVGQEDLPLGAVRSLVGEKILVGVSTHTADEALEAAREGADYVGVGPVFPTTTKDAGTPLGIPGLTAILKELSIPAFAIGGITAENAPDLARAGARQWAVCSGILSAEDVPARVRAYLDALSA